jgi:hypothetical protein
MLSPGQNKTDSGRRKRRLLVILMLFLNYCFGKQKKQSKFLRCFAGLKKAGKLLAAPESVFFCRAEVPTAAGLSSTLLFTSSLMESGQNHSKTGGNNVWKRQ